MKSPLWIITSTFAIILVALFAFILYSMKSLFVAPKTATIKVSSLPELGKKEEAVPRDVSIIYEEHDLFSTYRPSIMPVKPIDILPAIPTPPLRIPMKNKPAQAMQFLKPLPLKISGIIGSNNEMKSQVSFVNTNTGKTESFKVGDKVLDAYILRILPKKVIVVRSNGQQETIYVYANEAQEDIKEMQDMSWSDVVQQQSEHSYLINPTAFSSRVPSLADLIEMLDLNTVSRGGKPLGVRIGNMKDTSLGFAAGFEPGDIITKIYSTAPVSTDERMALFNEIAALDLGAQIPVQYLRNSTLYTTTFTLFNLADPSAMLEPAESVSPQKHAALQAVPKNDLPQPKQVPQNIQAPVVHTSASPTMATRTDMKDTRKRDLDAMKRYGGRPAHMPPLSKGVSS
jgi:type II secretory pathway component PulC